MQFPGPAVLSGAAPVPEPVGDVAGLLDLIAADARPQGVDGAGGDMEYVPRTDRCPAQAVFQFSRLYDGTEILAPGIDPVHQFRAGVRVQNIPGFAFTGFALMEPGIIVAGMNLHGEGLPGIQELEQKGEGFSRDTGEPVSPEIKDFPQGFSPAGAVGNAAFMAGQGGNFQAFAGNIVRRILAELFFQGITAQGVSCPWRKKAT
jgi:hypothetical protein